MKRGDSPEPSAELIESWIKKTAAGEKPTREEDAARRRHEKATEEANRWKYYGTIPRKHWLRLSGKHHATVDNYAARFGIPMRGETVDLAAVVQWLYGFLEKKGDSLSDQEALIWSGPGAEGSAALEICRMEKAKALRLDRMAREGNMVNQAAIRKLMNETGRLLRDAGERMRDIPKAHRTFLLALDNCEGAIRRFEDANPGIPGWDAPDENGQTDALIESNRQSAVNRQ